MKRQSAYHDQILLKNKYIISTHYWSRNRIEVKCSPHLFYCLYFMNQIELKIVDLLNTDYIHSSHSYRFKVNKVQLRVCLCVSFFSLFLLQSHKCYSFRFAHSFYFIFHLLYFVLIAQFVWQRSMNEPLHASGHVKFNFVLQFRTKYQIIPFKLSSIVLTAFWCGFLCN